MATAKTKKAAAPPAGDKAGKPAGGNNGGEKKGVLALLKTDVVDVVTERVMALTGKGELELPKNYSVRNAMMDAWLKLQVVEDRNGRLALEVCSRNSIANALMDMVVQGLNPGRGQCYFIAYGTQLTCQRSYMGSIALVKRIFGPQAQVFSEVVYEGDKLRYTIERGTKIVSEHEQELGNVNPEKIVGAYAILDTGAHGLKPHCEIMTIDQIRRAWEQGATGGKSPAHKKFPDEMSRKTVINRTCKLAIAAADDSNLLVRAALRQDALVAETAIDFEASEAADGEILDLDSEEVETEAAAPPPAEPAAEGETEKPPEPAAESELAHQWVPVRTDKKYEAAACTACGELYESKSADDPPPLAGCPGGPADATAAPAPEADETVKGRQLNPRPEAKAAKRSPGF